MRTGCGLASGRHVGTARAVHRALVGFVLGGLARSAVAQQCGQWNEIYADPSPPGRSGHTMTFDSVHGITLLFGGVAPPQLGDLWRWDGIQWYNLNVTGPPARAGQRMAFDAGRGVAVLLGNALGAFESETWEFDGNAWSRIVVVGPQPRFEHALAYDSARGVMVLFGGKVEDENGNADVGDTWEYDGASWNQVFPVDAPTPRHNHAMAYDSARGVTVLYGGYEDIVGLPSSETWEWDGADWSLRSSSGPPPAFSHALVYATDTHRTLLIPGGAPADNPAIRTWAWDGNAWELLPATDLMQNRSAFAAAFDSVRNVAVVFGGAKYQGEDISAGSDTFELPSGIPTAISQDPGNLIAATGNTAHFSIVANGANLTYQWYRNSNLVGDDGRITGSNTANLSIAALSNADDGQYFVVVSGECGFAQSSDAALTVYPRGDMNCDDRFDNFDIDPFVLALVEPDAYAATFPNCGLLVGDIDGSGAFNNFDIDPFVALLIGP